MNHNKNWQSTLLSLYRLRNSVMSITQKQWLQITGRYWAVINMPNWAHRMNFQNESEQWTGSSHFPNTVQSSRYSWCACPSLGRPKPNPYHREVRKIFCLLSNVCLLQSNMKAGHNRFRSGYNQTFGHSSNLCLRVGSLLDHMHLWISKIILFPYIWFFTINAWLF